MTTPLSRTRSRMSASESPLLGRPGSALLWRAGVRPGSISVGSLRLRALEAALAVLAAQRAVLVEPHDVLADHVRRVRAARQLEQAGLDRRLVVELQLRLVLQLLRNPGRAPHGREGQGEQRREQAHQAASAASSASAKL